jgi:hypothetical protein
LHFYNIKMKDGTKHDNVLLTNEHGQVGNPFLSLLRDGPTVHVMTFKNFEMKLHALNLLEIECAVCENERVGLGKIRDVDELPLWLGMYRTYASNRTEIDALPEGEKVPAVYVKMMKRQS